MKKRILVTAVIVLLLSPVLSCRAEAVQKPAGEEAAQEHAAAAEAAVPAEAVGHAEISGVEALQIAVQGESLAVFAVGDDYRFLPIEGKGVRFDEKTGRLTTTPEAEEQTVAIAAESKDGRKRLSRDIMLYKSWRLGPDVADIARFPDPKNVKGPQADWLHFFQNGKLAALRAAVLAAAAVPTAAYAVLRRRTGKSPAPGSVSAPITAPASSPVSVPAPQNVPGEKGGNA